MKNDNIEYRPYIINIYFIPIPVVGEIISLMLCGIAIQTQEIQSLFWLGILSIACAFLIKWIYDSTKVVVVFEESGIRLINESIDKYYYFPWVDFSYAYYCKDWHGHMYLVLSSERLVPKEVKKKVNQSANSLSFKMYIDNVVVICIDTGKNQFWIEEIISKKIPFVKKN